MNNELKYEGVKIQTNTEYTPKYLDEILSKYKMVCNIDESKFVYGKEVKLKSNWRFIWFQSALISTNFIQNKSDCKKLLEFSTLRCFGEGGVYSFLNNCLIFCKIERSCEE